MSMACALKLGLSVLALAQCSAGQHLTGTALQLNAAKRPATPTHDVYKQEFEAFKQRFSKKYASSADEKAHFEAFKTNYDMIQANNAANNSYRLEINSFADLTLHEFSRTRGAPSSLRLQSRRQVPRLGVHKSSNRDLPTSVDWRSKGAMTAVKNQGSCGGCWAFSATAAVEAAWYIATNHSQLLTLSVQELIDCDPYTSGCGGGNPVTAWQYEMQNQSICTEGSYPYKAAQDNCHKKTCVVAIPSGGLTGAIDVPSNDVNALMDAVAQTPVTVSIAASSNFQLYKDGVMTASCDGNIDHSVLLAGYGTDNGKDYWLIRNSWGSGWGEKGYARLIRGTKGPGECLIAAEPAYPIVDGSKALSSMNPIPLGKIALVIGASLVAIIASASIFLFARKKCKARQGSVRSIRPSPIVTPTAAAAPQQSQQSSPATTDQTSERKGNSRASRLLQGQ